MKKITKNQVILAGMLVVIIIIITIIAVRTSTTHSTNNSELKLKPVYAEYIDKLQNVDVANLSSEDKENLIALFALFDADVTFEDKAIIVSRQGAEMRYDADDIMLFTTKTGSGFSNKWHSYELSNIIPEPSFGEIQSCAFYKKIFSADYSKVSAADFAEYVSKIKENGFVIVENKDNNVRFKKDKYSVYLTLKDDVLSIKIVAF